MKYLKYFETEAEYIQFKNTEDYVLPNVSYVEEIDGIMFNADDVYISPNVVCTYNVTDISQETQILDFYGLDSFSSMIVDGVEMEDDTYYQFDTVGNHVIEFVLSDPTRIGTAFQNCISLISVTIPDSVTTINDYAFSNCSSLQEFNCKYASEDSRCLIVDGRLIAFAHAGLTEYTIPDSVTTIGSSVFWGCSGLTSIVIPNSVTTIENNAFSDCSSLTSVTIGSGVTNMEWSIFYNCNNLASITCYASTAPSISYDTFMQVSNDGTLYVPTGSDYSSWMSTDGNYLGKYNWTIQYI